MRPVGKQLVGNRVETVQCLMHRIQIGLAGTRQRQSAVVSDEQGRAEIGLQLTHLLTDRGLGDIELLAGKGETQSATGCLKSSQNI